MVYTMCGVRLHFSTAANASCNASVADQLNQRWQQFGAASAALCSAPLLVYYTYSILGGGGRVAAAVGGGAWAPVRRGGRGRRSQAGPQG
eukprot:COSAG01_NODE_24215_length_786_cov_1.443959_1_plen_89_part_01